MKTSALFTSLALLASISVEAHGHSGPHHFVHRRHAAPAMAKRSDLAKRRLDLQRRKTPGTGDSTSLPDNAAEGSDSDECAVSVFSCLAL